MIDDLKECLELLKDYGASTAAPWELTEEKWGVLIGEEQVSGVCLCNDGSYIAGYNDGEAVATFENVNDACKWLKDRLK